MSTAGGFEDPGTVDVDASSAENSQPPRSRNRFLRNRAELITSAQRSPSQNRRSRETTYLILQGMRIPFVLLSIAAVLWWHNWTLAIIFFCISIPLPWISVVIANEKNEVRDRRTQNVYKPAAARQYAMEANRQTQIEAGSGTTASDPGTIEHED